MGMNKIINKYKSYRDAGKPVGRILKERKKEKEKSRQIIQRPERLIQSSFWNEGTVCTIMRIIY